MRHPNISRLAAVIATLLGLGAIPLRAQVNYYFATLQNTGADLNPAPNTTMLAITGASDGTAYAIKTLPAGAPVAAGVVNRGQHVHVTGLADYAKFQLTTSAPVTAYLGYDEGTAQLNAYQGGTFFVSVDGVSEIGRRFMLPLTSFGGQTAPAYQLWVFTRAAGTVSLKALDGTVVISNTFGASGGAWQIPGTAVSSHTVYALESADVDFSIQQSSSDSVAEVPPATQAASPSACAVGAIGREFRFALSGTPTKQSLAVFPYGDGTYTLTPLTIGGTPLTDIPITTGVAEYREGLKRGAYLLTATADIGLIVGMTDGGPGQVDIWHLGDDALLMRGAGNSVRGHALECGGTVFAGQDGTLLDGNGAQVALNAGEFSEFPGNTVSYGLFHFTSQDAAHPLLVQAFGGNCASKLNDWGKVLRPQGLGLPALTFPTAGAEINSSSPVVTGSGIPGATVTLRVRDDANTVVFTGTGTVDTTGAWSITVTPPLPDGDYTFTAVQALPGICPVNPDPPPVGPPVILVTPPGLRRSADLTTLTPDAAVKAAIFPNAPGDPSLPDGPDHVIVEDHLSGAHFPGDDTDLSNPALPIIFYQLDRPSAPIHLDTVGGHININY